MEFDGDIIQKAIYFANEKHNGQFRKDGTPYITHPLRVADIVKKFKQSHRINELMAAAILHDILEETDTDVLEFAEEFGELVTMLVIGLTNEKSKIEKLGKTNYLSRKLASSKKVSRWALVIKLADRLDNVSDLKYASKEFAERYKRETEEILAHLEKTRKLTPTQKDLILSIREKIIDIGI